MEPTEAGDSTSTAADDPGETRPDDGDDHPGGERAAEGDTGPTPQSAALRRQQRYVGVGGALLAGVALATGTFQRFPETPVAAVLAGLLGTAVVLWVVRRSVFPGEAATAENTGEEGA